MKVMLKNSYIFVLIAIGCLTSESWSSDQLLSEVSDKFKAKVGRLIDMQERFSPDSTIAHPKILEMIAGRKKALLELKKNPEENPVLTPDELRTVQDKQKGFNTSPYKQKRNPKSFPMVNRYPKALYLQMLSQVSRKQVLEAELRHLQDIVNTYNIRAREEEFLAKVAPGFVFSFEKKNKPQKRRSMLV